MKKRVGFRGGFAALEHHKRHTLTYLTAELLTDSCNLHITRLDDHFYAEFLRTAAYALMIYLNASLVFFLYFITREMKPISCCIAATHQHHFRGTALLQLDWLRVSNLNSISTSAQHRH